MANICTNIAVVTGTDQPVLEQVVKEISESFECYWDIETQGGYLELEFTTRGAFPKDIMESITGKYTGKGLYIQVVTYELSNELVEHHIYENGQWADRLAERYRKPTV